MKIKKITAAVIAGIMLTSALPVINVSAEPTVSQAQVSKASVRKLSAPKGLKAAEVTDVSVTISWNAVTGADAYRVYIYDKKKKKYVTYADVNDTKCSVTGLESGTKYRFIVAALVNSAKGYKVQKRSAVLKASTEFRSFGGESPIKYSPNTIIISTKPGTTADDLADMLKEYDMTILYDYSIIDAFALSLKEGRDEKGLRALCAELTEKYDFVVYAELDHIITPDDPVSDGGSVSIF